jgi:hypothetical protein
MHTRKNAIGTFAEITKAGRPTALLIGHPGHELRVYGWLRMVRPTVCVLTDGSGTTGKSRLERTTHLLSGIGAKPGTVYGRLTDREIYYAMMGGEVARFTEMVDELADSWIEDGIEVAASDANEGYSPTHDLCCEMARAATELVRRKTGRQIQLYSFCLTEWESPKAEDFPEHLVCVRLSDEVRDEKIAAARSYAELAEEVGRALALMGPEYFGEEYLIPAGAYTGRDGTDKPTYERFGEQRVAEGKYTNVLRYEHHVLPVFRALRKHVALRGADLMKANS